VPARRREDAGRLARIVSQCLAEGARVEIDGLGTFVPGGPDGVQFLAQTKPRVFLAYVEEDLAAVRRLHDALTARRFDPWLDKTRLVPGQNWPRAIESAIQTSDFFIGCFSSRSLVKRGTFQGELRFALECARQMPLDEIFFIPVRLEPCAVPASISQHIQYVDLFPDHERAVRRIAGMMSAEVRKRNGRGLRLLRNGFGGAELPAH